jgi:O-antigen/teichoic acid export membrane protein
MSKGVSQQRTLNYFKQIKGSFFFKGLAVLASFIAIPLMIRYLGQEQFGIWSTLLSIMSWVVFFDLGIGNGLRNKLTEALAKNDLTEAVCYISSGYSLIGLISFFLFIMATIASFYIPWQYVFNTMIVDEETLKRTVLISVFFVTLNFWVSIINQILNAVQKTSAVVFGQFISNVLSLALVFFLITRQTTPSIYYLALVYGISLIISNSFLSLWFYNRHRDLIPRLSMDMQHIRPILSLGVQFFVIQVAVLVIFTTDKILITQLFGPQYVTQYDVVFKLFGIISLIHTLITGPLWSSYTDAYHRGDFVWIKAILGKQFIIFGVIVIIVIIMIPMVKPIIALWISDDFEISMPLVISMAGFILISTWSNIFAIFVNGIGQIKLQLFTAIIAMIINIPLAIYFTKYLGFGVNGIVLATCTSLSLFAIVGPIQVHFILRDKSSPCIYL